MSRGDTWPTLQGFARQFFSLVASTAASEHNFLTFGFVHTKLRNCLTEASVETLVYIKTYNLQLTKQDHSVGNLKEDDSDYDSEIEKE